MKPSYLHAQKILAGKSDLFDVGELAAAPDDHAFVRRLNALIVMKRGLAPTIRPPATLSVAVLAKGRISEDAELVAFSQWLITEGAPGLANPGGRAAQPRTLLSTLGVALAELLARERAMKADDGSKSNPAPLRLTSTVLAKRWEKLFSEPVTAADMSSRVRSLKRHLRAYLDHIAKGGFYLGGKVANRSPRISRVLSLIDGALSSPAVKPSPAKTGKAKSGVKGHGTAPARTPIDASDLGAFDYPLRYSASSVEEDYRQRPAGALPQATLRYRVERYAPGAKSTSTQPSRGNHVLLVPDLDITRHFRIKALIDRMVVLLSTQTNTSVGGIRKVLAEQAVDTAFVHDRTIVPAKVKDWRSKLPELDLTKPTGEHFAILFQEPTKRTLKSALQAIDKQFTIVGPVEISLCELAIDFVPNKDQQGTTADERLILREQMVAALQRHHWCRAEKLESAVIGTPRFVDARQIYEVSGTKSSTTRYFFSKKTGSAALSDVSVEDPNVRLRILSAQSNEALMLNAQMFRGAADGDVLIRIQHKITDQRNPVKQTMKVLPEHERRARIEVELSGRNSLADLGLDVVEDLTRVQFRSLRKDLLVFRLPLVEAFKEDLQMAKEQMSCRGIYGWQLWKQAQAAHRKELEQRAGRSVAPTSRNKPQYLTAWLALNKDVGQALDNLEKRWKAFAWR